MRRAAGWKWGILAGLWAAVTYVWILPLVRPRGAYLWGHYQLRDMYVGIPLGLAAVCGMVFAATPSRHRRRVALRATVVCGSIVMALFASDVAYTVGLQGALRSGYWLEQRHIPRAWSTADPELGFVRKAGISWDGLLTENGAAVRYRTDENGFRNPPGLRRADVVFIGDSFTEAGGIQEEDTFVELVASSTGVRVANLGRGAYGPQQELIVLRRYGLSYRPRVVVWQLFEGNDLGDAREFAEWRQNGQGTQWKIVERYFSNSLITRMLSRTMNDATFVTARVQYHDGQLRHVAFRYVYEPDPLGRNPVGLEETQQALESAARLCRSEGIDLLVLFVPIMARVMEPFVTFEREENRTRVFRSGIHRPGGDLSSWLAASCESLGCSYVDLFPTLRDAALRDNTDVYNREDPDEHLGVAGHKVAAGIVASWLRSRSARAEPHAGLSGWKY